MRERQFSEEELREDRIRSAKSRAYAEVCPPMSRAERRTAKGRMLVAQAEAAALRAELELLRSELTPSA
jgi:hypothetical protein